MSSRGGSGSRFGSNHHGSDGCSSGDSSGGNSGCGTTSSVRGDTISRSKSGNSGSRWWQYL